MSVTVLHGDCRALLPTLAAESVDCCITSPPYYNLRDYGTAVWEGGEVTCGHEVRRWEGDLQTQGAQSGHASPADRLNRSRCTCGAVRVDHQVGLEQTPEEYVENLVAVFAEVYRVLKPTGTLWLNLGDSYATGSSRTTGRNDADFNERTKELYGKRSSQHHYADQPRTKLCPKQGVRPKNLLGIPWRVAFALQEWGWVLRSDVIWAKGNALPESVKDRPARSHEYLFLLAKNERYYYDHVAVREPGVYPAGTRGAKGSAARQAEKGVNARPPEYKVYDGWRNKRTVWNINTKPFAGSHFAVMPAALVAPCVLASSSERGCCANCGIPWRRRVEAGEPVKVQNGGPKTQTKALVAKGKHGESNVFHTGHMCPPVTVGWEPGCRCGREDPVPAVILDPFAGSGTVGEVALKHGRSVILIELNEAYLPFIHERTRQESFIL